MVCASSKIGWMHACNIPKGYRSRQLHPKLCMVPHEFLVQIMISGRHWNLEIVTHPRLGTMTGSRPGPSPAFAAVPRDRGSIVRGSVGVVESLIEVGRSGHRDQ
jgi:hypothetical protein